MPCGPPQASTLGRMPEFVSAVEDAEIVLRYPDDGHFLDAVRLWHPFSLDLPRVFVEVPGGWELRMPHPPLGRLQYLIEVTAGEDTSLVTDPTNPLVVEGVFGDHSWLPLPGYQPPWWVEAPALPSEWCSLSVPVPGLADEAELGVHVWSPGALPADQPAPLLLSHDGPEMDALGRITQYAAVMIGAEELPSFRVALLEPGPRNQWYAANDAYADSLVRGLLPVLSEAAPVTGRPVLMGQSLGGLAALHAAWRHPDVFSGVFSQSGSFFTPLTDAQESGFESFTEITAFTAEVFAAAEAPAELPLVGLVCGTAEENLDNNRRMAAELAERDACVRWGQVDDGHTWTCWRDLLDPHLTDLLQTVWA